MIGVVSDRGQRRALALEDIDAIPLLLDLAPRLTLRVATWSMFPTIHRGDRLEIGPAHRLRIGDVVLFRAEPGIVCHRVAGIGADGTVRAHADASPGREELLSAADVIGIVTAVVRGGVRLSPTRVHGSSMVARLRRAVDDLTRRGGARVLARGGSWLRWSCRRRSVRRAARKFLPGLVRLDIALRVPLRCVSGSRVLGRVRLDADRIDTDFPLERFRWEDVVLVARLGRCELARYHAMSGEVSVRGAASGLGLEEVLRRQWSVLSRRHPQEDLPVQEQAPGHAEASRQDRAELRRRRAAEDAQTR